MDFLSEVNLSQKNGLSASVTTGDWIKFMCLGLLNIIPVVGSLAYLGVLIYLAVSSTTADSLKSYIKASLIVAVVCLALSTIMMFGLFGLLASSFKF